MLKRWGIRFAALALGCLALATACGGCGQARQAQRGNALFCWNWAAARDWAQSGIFEAMDAAGLTVLHQYVPDDADFQALTGFLSAAGARKIGVYLLTGEPEWGLDEKGAALCAEVARAAAYNALLPEDARLRGVLADVEPYLTSRWDRDAEGAMDAYASAMAAARASASEAGLELVACIPWFYDSRGHEAALERVISEGCDALAIMNYRKKAEAGQIETELRLAEGKPVCVIYELQRPGDHGLTARNTYFEEGLPGVEQSVAALRERYGAGAFSYALHDYDALKELWKN